LKIVGLVGFMGSGKGTVADILVSDYGYEKISFADKLKDAVSVVFGWPRHLLEGDTDESRAFREQEDQTWSDLTGRRLTPRLVLQLIGTEGFRDVIHPDIWIFATFNQISKNPDKKYVIADARFKNEVNYIRNNGGQVYRVKRGDDPEWFKTASLVNCDTSRLSIDVRNFCVNKAIEKMKELEIHESEWRWIGSNFNDTIHNDADINALKRVLSELPL
jgi:hypothetical protein